MLRSAKCGFKYLNSGILHKGLAHSPTGGHWIIVIGYQDDPSAPDGGWWIVHDPWGEIDNPSGTYDSSGNQGRNEQYSYNLMNSRWTVEGANDGWSILIH